MIKIEFETADFLPHMIEVEEKNVLDQLIKITSDGGHINWVERI